MRRISFLLCFIILALTSTMPIIRVQSVTFTVPSQSSLWITAPQTYGYQAQQSYLATNSEHNVIVCFSRTDAWLKGFSDEYSTQALFGTDFLRGRRGSIPLFNDLWTETKDNATNTFAGTTVMEDDIWMTGDFQCRFLIPYNLTGFIADISYSAIVLQSTGFGYNWSSYATLSFNFGNSPITKFGEWMSEYQVGNTTASWNNTLQAIVVNSVSPNRDGYVAFKPQLEADSTGNWNCSYEIADNTITPSDWQLSNGTVGTLPTTTTNVFGALAYSNEEQTDQTLKLHFSVYVTFGNSPAQLQTRLNELTGLDFTQSLADSNDYWYNLYIQNSAVNFNNDNLNRLYYWPKHLLNVGYAGNRYYLAGADYGLYPYTQDGSYAVFSALACGLWTQAYGYLQNVLDNWIYTGAGSGNEFNGTSYSMKYLVEWKWDDLYGTSSPQIDEGSPRGTLDFLDSIVRYIAWTGNTSFAQSNWTDLTNMIEALYDIVEFYGTGVLPLTNGNEDVGSSLMCNILFYNVLKGFSAISTQLGNSSYATTLESRASTLKTQFNKEVGSGGLWSSINGYFVSSSWVSASDTNPILWTWQNALAITYDVVDGADRQQSIMYAVKQKCENTWGFGSNQNTENNWYMKQFEVAKAYSVIHDSSKINKLLWANVNNPQSGIPHISETTTSKRFNFPEWFSSVGSSSWVLQYAWSSSPISMILEVLLGVQPSINAVNIQAIKPANVTTITSMNTKVRDALWNISITGNGDYVSEVSVDGMNLDSTTIPSSFYTGNHLVEIILGSMPLKPEVQASGLYNLQVYIKRDDLPLAGAEVDIVGLQTLLLDDIESKTTEGSGKVSWQLPYGVYAVTVKYDDEVKTMTVWLNSDRDIGFDFGSSGGKHIGIEIILVPLFIFIVGIVILPKFLRRR